MDRDQLSEAQKSKSDQFDQDLADHHGKSGGLKVQFTNLVCEALQVYQMVPDVSPTDGEADVGGQPMVTLARTRTTALVAHSSGESQPPP